MLRPTAGIGRGAHGGPDGAGMPDGLPAQGTQSWYVMLAKRDNAKQPEPPNPGPPFHCG